MKEVRFDQYSVSASKYHMVVLQITHDLPLMLAVIMSGVEEADFTESMAQEGWVGSCPQWCKYMPIVTVPVGDKLDMDQVEFMLDSLLARQ